ncbi:Protease Do-like 2, chloroplastic [Symbiodinium microadriaticum]|uniref:Protease Do-like 2, chloroplastic n=1 Tax=Symbiodinium microadriaticum TaxID=2951 RepID=A0A1Q9DBX9_SYMMI|nr:Protease Do-like 2, chloroplastic [Symbiodinium microadriaticum]
METCRATVITVISTRVIFVVTIIMSFFVLVTTVNTIATTVTIISFLLLLLQYHRRLSSPQNRGDAQPSYLIVGGLVFVRLTLPWMLSRFREASSQAGGQVFMEDKIKEHKTSPEQEIVVLAKVLAAEVNYGYEDFQCLELLGFGSCSKKGCSDPGAEGPSQTAESLKQLYKYTSSLLGSKTSEPAAFLRFEFSPWFSHLDGLEIVLDVEQCRRSGAGILRQHGIARDCSRDLLDDPVLSRL